MRRSKWTGPISIVLFAFVLFFIARYVGVAETVSAVYEGSGAGFYGLLLLSVFFIAESSVLYFIAIDDRFNIWNTVLCASLFLALSFLSSFTVFLNLVGAPAVFLLAPLYWYGRKGMTVTSAMDLLLVNKKDFWKNVLVGVVLFLFITGATIAIILALNLFGIADQEKVRDKITALPDYIFLIAVLFSPFAEELFFRGFLRRETGPILSSAIFGLFHIGYGSVVQVIAAFFIGFFFCYATTWRKNLVPAVVAHGFFNLSSLIMMRFFS